MLYKIRLKPFREQKFTLSFHTFTEKVCTYATDVHQIIVKFYDSLVEASYYSF